MKKYWSLFISMLVIINLMATALAAASTEPFELGTVEK